MPRRLENAAAAKKSVYACATGLQSGVESPTAESLTEAKPNQPPRAHVARQLSPRQCAPAGRARAAPPRAGPTKQDPIETRARRDDEPNRAKPLQIRRTPPRTRTAAGQPPLPPRLSRARQPLKFQTARKGETLTAHASPAEPISSETAGRSRTDHGSVEILKRGRGRHRRAKSSPSRSHSTAAPPALRPAPPHRSVRL